MEEIKNTPIFENKKGEEWVKKEQEAKIEKWSRVREKNIQL